MPYTFAEKVISFYSKIDFSGSLPDGITIMNPFQSNPDVMGIAEKFYRKFYSDFNERYLILGINPGRFGAGLTGIPFTDTNNLSCKCGIKTEGIDSREMSSVFIYDMIDEFGGVQKFYSKYLISAVCPLGFTAQGKKGKEVNYNYYDSRDLVTSVTPFIVENLIKQLDFGIIRDTGFCLGTGKNYRFLSNLNSSYGFFRQIIPLEHPRFIMQYRLKQKPVYIKRYLEFLGTGELTD